MAEWVRVHHPIEVGDSLPPERKCVLAWCASSHRPWVAYLRYAAGCLDSPFFVVPHGNIDRPVDVVAWCDCPPPAPEGFAECDRSGRGFPARVHNKEGA